MNYLQSIIVFIIKCTEFIFGFRDFPRLKLSSALLDFFCSLFFFLPSPRKGRNCRVRLWVRCHFVPGNFFSSILVLWRGEGRKSFPSSEPTHIFFVISTYSFWRLLPASFQVLRGGKRTFKMSRKWGSGLCAVDYGRQAGNVWSLIDIG